MNPRGELAVGGRRSAAKPSDRRLMDGVQWLGWTASAAISAYAGHLAVHQTTPIDRALPLLAVLATVIAAVSYSALMLAVPMLVLAEIAIVDESTRLLAFGAIFAASIGWAVAGARGEATMSRAWGSLLENGRRRWSTSTAIALTLALVLLLRWIPLEQVLVGRELALLVLASLIVLVLGSTPFAVAVAVGSTLLTPAIPLRTLALPIGVLFVCIVARAVGMPRIELKWMSAIALAFAALFFSWSGIVARALPYVLRPPATEAKRLLIAEALPRGSEATYSVPPRAKALVVSGANVARLRRGTPLGRIEPGGIALRVGDVADWGFLRRDQFHASRNPLPRDPAGRVRDYGYAAWVDGAGRVPLPLGAGTIRIVADASLPPGAALQVEAFEIGPQ